MFCLCYVYLTRESAIYSSYDTKLTGCLLIAKFRYTGPTGTARTRADCRRPGPQTGVSDKVRGLCLVGSV